MIDEKHQSSMCPHNRPSMDTCEECSGYEQHEGDDRKSDGPAMAEDSKRLGQHPGSSVVSRIMRSRASGIDQSYAEGGRVLPDDDSDLAELADGQDNDFDYMHNRELESFSDTGANSGDELGNAKQMEDRDIVKRLMNRRSKSRMPSPK